MGTLRVETVISNNVGQYVNGIAEIYIWREEADSLTDFDPEYTYWAARVPPGMLEYETVEEHTLTGSTVLHYSYVTTPRVSFKHKHSDGAELCIARAILALAEAGMNV